MTNTSILLVEDNVDLADNLSEIIEDAGYSVRSAASCKSARRAAESGFDVALVDVRLPDGDGIQLAPTLKDLAPYAEIILLTGFATLETAIAAVRSGAWAYLVKPCAPSDLLIALEQATKHVALQKDKQALAERARVAEKLAALGTMAAGLAHEIRNPLNAAQLQLKLAERLVRGVPSDALKSALESLLLVRSELDRLNRIVEDALNLARPSSLETATYDMSATITTVARFLEPDLAAAGVALELAGCDAPVSARYDEGRLKQVLVNLIRNGADAAGRGGRIRVALLPSGQTLTLNVEDSGPGVPDGIDPFVPYFTTKSKGTGLGLPLAHRIVSEHGGTLYISRRHGPTTFTAELPIIATD